MLPPELDSIAVEIKKRFQNHVAADKDGTILPEIQTAEEVVTTFVIELGRSMLQIFVDVREEQAKSARGPCRCGAPTEMHRRTQWTKNTLLGPVTVGDPYIYCRTCHRSERPLHAWLGSSRETWSLSAQEAAVDLATDESCGKAVEKLARHHPGVEMERTTALRLLHRHGRDAREFIDAKLSKASRLAELPRAQQAEGSTELEVEFDGGMIPVAVLEPIAVPEGVEPERSPVRGLVKRRRACRWEEAKVGLVQKPGEVGRLYSLRPTSGLDASFEDLFALACMKGWTEGTDVRGIADGAVHIRRRMEEAFNGGNFRFILDRPHAKEHLSQAGGALERVTRVPAQDWATSALTQLENGQVMSVVAELNRAQQHRQLDATSRDCLRLEAGYFERNADAVAYAEYRAAGWSTASSEVESAHRHAVQCRIKIPGAWWRPDQVDDILALRMLKANGWWNQYWQEQRQHWRERAKRFSDKRHAALA